MTLSLKPAGNAPTLKQSKFSVPGDRQVSWLLQWLKKALHAGPEESMVSSCSEWSIRYNCQSVCESLGHAVPHAPYLINFLFLSFFFFFFFC